MKGRVIVAIRQVFDGAHPFKRAGPVARFPDVEQVDLGSVEYKAEASSVL